MNTKSILIYGAGGLAKEIAGLIEVCNQAQPRYTIAGFIDDDATRHGALLNGFPIMGLATAYQQFPEAYMVGGIGSPRIRQKVIEKAQAIGFHFETIIHPRAEYSRWVAFGIGTVVFGCNNFTTDITVGQHVQVNPGCTIAHDVIIGDYVMLTPGVRISGNVHIGARAYIGSGSVISNGTPQTPLTIGEDAIIGAGACVIRSVPAGVTVVGVPAKPIKRA